MIASVAVVSAATVSAHGFAHADSTPTVKVTKVTYGDSTTLSVETDVECEHGQVGSMTIEVHQTDPQAANGQITDIPVHCGDADPDEEDTIAPDDDANWMEGGSGDIKAILYDADGKEVDSYSGKW